jgi:hypothetical protein
MYVRIFVNLVLVGISDDHGCEGLCKDDDHGCVRMMIMAVRGCVRIT